MLNIGIYETRFGCDSSTDTDLIVIFMVLIGSFNRILENPMKESL